MTKRKIGRPRIEYLIRSIDVRSIKTHISARPATGKTPHLKVEGKCWMQVRGVFDEPVKGQSEVVISIHEDERAFAGQGHPDSVGCLLERRPELRVLVHLNPDLFHRTWLLAAGGRLTHAWMSLTKPHYNDAWVPAVAFANEPIE
jgi:hypothetical protein